jgi:hypothetical protein
VGAPTVTRLRVDLVYGVLYGLRGRTVDVQVNPCARALDVSRDIFLIFGKAGG